MTYRPGGGVSCARGYLWYFRERCRSSIMAMEEKMKPSATHKWLLASVMGVSWAIATTVLWALLALGFGRSKSDPRLITVLIFGAVIVALLVAHAYSEGWRGGSKATVNPRKDSKP